MVYLRILGKIANRSHLFQSKPHSQLNIKIKRMLFANSLPLTTIIKIINHTGFGVNTDFLCNLELCTGSSRQRPLQWLHIYLFICCIFVLLIHNAHLMHRARNTLFDHSPCRSIDFKTFITPQTTIYLQRNSDIMQALLFFKIRILRSL